jgi:hypothetical protein
VVLCRSFFQNTAEKNKSEVFGTSRRRVPFHELTEMYFRFVFPGNLEEQVTKTLEMERKINSNLKNID